MQPNARLALANRILLRPKSGEIATLPLQIRSIATKLKEGLGEIFRGEDGVGVGIGIAFEGEGEGGVVHADVLGEGGGFEDVEGEGGGGGAIFCGGGEEQQGEEGEDGGGSGDEEEVDGVHSAGGRANRREAYGLLIR